MVKKKSLIFTAIVALVMIAFMVCACTALNPEKNESYSGSSSNASITGGEDSTTTQLQIVKSEYKFTQEQALSRIKAEYLIENGGYKDTDNVVVTVSLKEKSLIECYNEYYYKKYSDIGEYAASEDGKIQLDKIESEQSKMLDSLSNKGIESSTVYTYSTILNALAIETAYGNLEKIESMSQVSFAMLSDTYNLPTTTSASSDASGIVNDVEIYSTGIYDSSSAIDSNGNQITGKGTAVAILDSGFDCSHSVFSTMPNCSDDELLIKESDIDSFLAIKGNNASKFTSGLETYQVYRNKKIPYGYDYADKDYDIFPYDSEHGTHVAGIIGGNDDVITGIAVDTQLVLMKVFPDLDSGGKTEDILAALEDAVLLNVDAINMSLGSSCGFSREEDNAQLNKVYDSIGNAGISLITAASNDYSAGYGGAQGNTNKVTNPDSGTVGSPSTYQASLSVASISGTKSPYIVANGDQVFFYKESNSIAGEENDFYEELFASLKKNGYSDEALSGDVTLQYVTVPGIGSAINFASVDVKGKIALIKRGTNTFEEKAANAKAAGAIACIIYNNIDGDILMSMGKTDHIPTISISKSDGTTLAKKSSGTMVFNKSTSKAGPFMSDFSSWGPTADLKLKPEITAHGGNILSAVPNGQYDELSGTSMATPNLCGIVILIRSYLKDKYPDKTWPEINSLTNQLLMSTATIIKNEEGNPYSPRKQGAGLASMRNVINTKAYLSVDGSDRPKLELGDDAEKTGVYTMQFNVENFSTTNVSYTFDFVGMSESVSTSDETFVSETPYILGGTAQASLLSGDTTATFDGTTFTIKAGQKATIKVVYTLTDADKNYIESSFPNGMYVEGFVKLVPTNTEDVQLNIPFLAFYGDWTEAPLFDKTYYEVESEAHDNAIDDEDKLKADYYATTPYGSYYYNYIIPLGTYLYDIDTDKYDAIPASTDHIAISNFLGSIDGIGSVYAGLLRNAKSMTFTITDKVTGEVVYETVDYNATKAHSNGGTALPYYQFDKIYATQLELVNNRQYEFKMVGLLDYGDGGLTTNLRNTFQFDFTMDNEAPVIKSAEYERTYDKTLKKYRYYVTLTVYDNHYVQAITPIIFTSSSSYTTLSDNPIPVYGEKGQDTKVRFEITDYLDDAYKDQIIANGLSFSIEDYALNTNLYICQLPGTNGDLKFTKTGDAEGSDLIILTVNEGDVVDLTQYLSSTDKNLDADKSYLNHLVWTTSNENVVTVDKGLAVGVKEGRATISAKEQMDARQAVLIINVKPKDKETTSTTASSVDTTDKMAIKEARFTYFDTLFAYSRAAQTSEINTTGSRVFINSLSSGINFYPGEKIQLSYDLSPWYVKDKYKVTFSSTNPTVATVTDEGVVTGLKEGSTTISLNIEGSNIKPSVRVTIKSPFVIENRTLIAYKGLGGNVVIPDDEGILYIGSFAFCLYTTDYTIEVSDDDYDKNKIPSSNTTVTSVVIPDGVQEIQKYAFYNCTGLREVAIPNDVKYIREYAFYNCEKLERVVLNDNLTENKDSKTYQDKYVLNNGNFTFKTSTVPSSLTGTKVEVIGANAFAKCAKLNNVDLSNVYAIGVRAFDDCTSLSTIDLTSLRNTGKEAFRGTTALESATMVKDTKLSYAMFAKSGIKTVDLYNSNTDLPEFLFAKCSRLTTVNVHGDIVNIGKGAFSECDALTTVNFVGKVKNIGEQAFYKSTALATLTLPNSDVSIESDAFRETTGLTTLKFGANTHITGITGALFKETGLNTFEVDPQNSYYQASGVALNDKAGTTLILMGVGVNLGEEYTLPSNYTKVGDSAFAGATFKKLVITNENVQIGAYAFVNCDNLTTVEFPSVAGTLSIGNNAFNGDTKITTLTNFELVKNVGQLAFAATSVKNITIPEGAVYGNGAFMNSKLETVTIGKNSSFGMSVFRNNTELVTVNMPTEGGVVLGEMMFAGDTKLMTIDLTKTNGIIPEEAFYGCSKLATADLTTTTVIGNYAFSDCRSLSTVTTAEGLVEIGEGAFSRNSSSGSAPSFTSFSIPSTVKKIGIGAFLGCQHLTSIVIPDALADATSDYAFGKAVQVAEGEEARNLNYGDMLFMYCTSLKTVTLPAGLKTIGSSMFYGCSSLTTVNGIASVEKIDEYGFAVCSTLESLDIQNVKEVGLGAFAQAGLVGTLNAKNLETVGDYAFQSTKFSYISAPKVKTIGEAAFQLNTNLKMYSFGDSIESIGLMPFYGCTALTEFTLATGKDSGTIGKDDYVKLEDGILYTKMASGKYQLSSVPAAKDIVILEVADGTARIDTYAANENKNITYVVLPDGLKLIGNYAFYGCENLDIVEFNSAVAPALEDSYNSAIALAEDDPGYDLIHNVFDLFGLELYYCTFVDVVGKVEPLEMVLPKNDTLSGYDALPYEAYFGAVEDAKRNDYIAMDESLAEFIEYAEKIQKASTITLAYDDIVTEAVTIYKSLSTDATKYGYTKAQWLDMVNAVETAQKTIKTLRVKTATYKAQQIQKEINELSSTFSLSMIDTLKALTKKLNDLEIRDKALLDLTTYNALNTAYNEYCEQLKEEYDQFDGITPYSVD